METKKVTGFERKELPSGLVVCALCEDIVFVGEPCRNCLGLVRSFIERSKGVQDWIDHPFMKVGSPFDVSVHRVRFKESEYNCRGDGRVTGIILTDGRDGIKIRTEDLHTLGHALIAEYERLVKEGAR